MTSIRPQLGPQNMGIASLLNPLLSHVNQQYQDNVVNPYVQQVEQLTTETFPNVQFGGSGVLGGTTNPFGGGGFPGGPTIMPRPRPMPPGTFPVMLPDPLSGGAGTGTGGLGTLTPLIR